MAYIVMSSKAFVMMWQMPMAMMTARLSTWMPVILIFLGIIIVAVILSGILDRLI